MRHHQPLIAASAHANMRHDNIHNQTLPKRHRFPDHTIRLYWPQPHFAHTDETISPFIDDDDPRAGTPDNAVQPGW